MLSTTLSLALLSLLSANANGLVARGDNRCVVESSKSTADDSPAIVSAFEKCSSNSIIEFSEGVNYNVYKPLVANSLSNVEIRILGNLSLPQDIPTVQKLVREAESNASGSALYSKLSWFTLKGKDVHIVGNPKMEAGWINSYGQQWYDANPPGKSGLPDRPHLMSFNVENGSLKYFKSMKPIGWNVHLAGRNITVSHARIDAISTGRGFPFNTDGFGTSATGVRITDSWIFNGDDALAVNNFAHDVVFENNIIGYETHGMSIGSLGQDPKVPADVSNIYMNNITMEGGLYAARFKSWKGGKGLVKNVTWSNININNVTFPIFVTQRYYNQDLSKRTDGNSAVEMQDFTWVNFTGIINDMNPGDGSCVSNPCWYDVGYPDLTHREAAIIACENTQSCKNFHMSNIRVIPKVKMMPNVVCINAEADLNPKLGFKCENGTFSGV